MNVLIPYNWIQDFVETDASPEEIAEKLSLHALSVENITTRGDDHIFEIEITPNRPDALSVLGIAREIGAVFTQYPQEAKFQDKEPKIKLKEPEESLPLHVRIKNPNLCPHFSAIVLDNVEIKQSPPQIQERLEKVGIRSLNNAIDITNYLMIERGQPMHVFDYDKISGNKMILRESGEGETLTTLDGKERDLPAGTIIIQDEDKLIDLCGIMGGANSCVDMGTTRIVLFVQIYDPQRIRETTQRMGFRTEASARFEKGMDPRGVVGTLKHATRFLRENANAQIASKLIDIENQTYVEQKIILSEEDVEGVLGAEVDPRQISTILRALGFEIDWLTSPDDISGAPELRATVPSWRSTDVKEGIDLVEEIARIYGYHNISSNLPPLPEALHQEENTFHWEKIIKKYLEGWGHTEIKTTSFTNGNELRKTDLDPKNALKIQNPLTEEATLLRPSLIPKLLSTCSQNQKWNDSQAIFQLSRVFAPLKEDNKLPNEQRRLAGLRTGKNEEDAFYKAKGTVEALLAKLGIEDVKFIPLTKDCSFWKRNASSEIQIGQKKKRKIGQVGVIKKDIQQNFKIEKDIAGFNINTRSLIEFAQKFKAYQPLPPHPPIIEDLTFEVGERTLVANIKNVIEETTNKDYQIEITVKTVYQDTALKKEKKKRVTLTLKYNSETGSLSDKDIKPLREKIVKAVEEKFEAKLTGNI